jgi:hypothetical protein
MRFLPPKDADLLAWATNFTTLIGLGFASYGLTTGQATTFNTLKNNFASALALATNNSTKTKSTVADKNAKRALMVANARLLSNIVQAYPLTTNQQRQDLGLTVRDTSGSPIGPPSTSPIVSPLNTSNTRVNFRFADELTPASRSKPFGAVALQLFAKVGTVPPVGINDCSLIGTYTNNTTGPGSAACQAIFAPADAGKTAYMYGRWINRRGEVGPPSPLATSTIAA